MNSRHARSDGKLLPQRRQSHATRINRPKLQLSKAGTAIAIILWVGAAYKWREVSRSAAMRCQDWRRQTKDEEPVYTNNEKFVRKLTLAPICRRWVGGFQTGRFQWAVNALLLLASTSIAADVLATTPAWQATDDISKAAENYLRDKVGSAASKTSVQAGSLDSRHRLAYCSQPLQAFLRRGTRIKARTIVGVRCAGSKPWKVYVPVDVIVTETVFVAKRSLPRGHQLSADDVMAEQRDVSRLLSGYISDLKQLAGLRLKTQLLAGKILTPAMLQVKTDIRRGQTVTLTIGRGQFAIRTSGTALVDGTVNQRIRVKNTQSGRIVEGIVRSREQVEVLLSSSKSNNTSSNSSFTNATTELRPKASPTLADTRSSNNDR